MPGNATPNLILQNLGTGGELANALRVFSGQLLAAFDNTVGVSNFGLTKTITSGSSVTWEAIWKMSGGYHTPGAGRAGSATNPTYETRPVTLDAREYTTEHWMSKRDFNISHFDPSGEVALKMAQNLREWNDTRALRVIHNGAAQAARSPFPAGITVTRVDAGFTAVTDVYPKSLTGSENLQADLADVARLMDVNNVSKEGRMAFITPYLGQVLRQDKTLLSVDFTSPNNLFTRKLMMVEGFNIWETNLMPSTSIGDSGTGGSDTTGHNNYEGDFTKLSCLAIGDPSAFGVVQFGGIDAAGPLWHEEQRSWLLSAAMHNGLNWLRPEACARINWATS